MLSAAMRAAPRWRSQFTFAVVDQACSSAANFLLTVIAARSLPLETFGLYGNVWAISLLAEAAAGALIGDPLPAIVGAYGGDKRRNVVAAAVWIACIYSALTSAATIVAAATLRPWALEFSVLLLCFAVANPLQRMQYFVRRLCYLEAKGEVAAAASAVFALIQLGVAEGLAYAGLFSGPVAVLTWALASGGAVTVGAAAGVVQLRTIRIRLIRSVWGRLWQSGSWLLGAAIAYWIGNQGVIPIMTLSGGAKVGGMFRALQNLFSPVIQVNTAVGLPILPRVAEAVAKHGRVQARVAGTVLATGFAVVAVTYSAALLENQHRVLDLVYGRFEIGGAISLLWPLAMLTVSDSIGQGAAIALLAAADTRAFLYARILSVVIFCGLSVPLGRALGAEGILWALVAASGSVTAVFARRLGR